MNRYPLPPAKVQAYADNNGFSPSRPLGSICNTGAGMLNGWGSTPAIIPAREKRISDPARRVLVLRNWLEAMEEAKPSSYRYQQIFLTEPKLREAASFVIGYCA